MKIVGIGACVMDTLFTVSDFPAEDTKTRAVSSKTAGGGPTATGLVAAQKLGVPAGYIGVLSSDNGGQFLLKDFQKYGVDTSLVNVLDGYRSFASVIWLAQHTASRTCVFDRGDLPKLRLNEAQKQAIRDAAILMVDGNEMDAAEEACRIARESDTLVLYDCGGLYEGVERLLKLTDIMIPSQEFAQKHTGTNSPEEAAQRLMTLYHPRCVTVTCGKEGGVYYDGSVLKHYPAFPVQAVDTNGSGDVFHGAFACGIVSGFSYEKCCVFSSAVSALKCTGIGARESVPSMEQTIQFLKENGYEL